jgi:hypothetical protein
MILLPLLFAEVSVVEIITRARAILVILVVLIVQAVCVAAFWGLAKRKVYGKWHAIVSLLIFWGLITYTQLFPPRGPYQRYEYNNAAEVAGAFFALWLIHALFLIVILRLAFAKNVNQFFGNRSGEIIGEDATTAV